MRTALRVWAFAWRRFLQPSQWSPYHLLWGNPNMPHFRLLPESQLWAPFGFQIPRDVISVGLLFHFRDFLITLRFPTWTYFQYLQLCHVAWAQFPVSLQLATDPIKDLLAQESLSKCLSFLYLELLCVESPKMEALWEA